METKMEKKMPENEKKEEQGLSVLWLAFTIISIVQAVVLFFVCRKLPDKVPIHFNLAMKVDRYGSPWELLVIASITPLLFIIRPLIDTKFSQNPRNIKIQDGIILFSGIFIASIAWWTTALAFQPVEEQTQIVIKQLPFFIYIILGVFTVVFGNYEGKIKPNKTLGIKIPWTIADNENWRKTHRFVAPCTVAAGIILTAGGFAGLFTNQMIWYLVSILLYITLVVILPPVYSFLLSRKARN
jgi:uncharacterized membrane protein